MWQLIFLAIVALKAAISSEVLPILIWHSAAETCCGDEINSYSEIINSQFKSDVYIKSVQIGKTPEEDRINSLTRHPFKQIESVCKEILHDEKFKNGYNGIGLSQGGLFMRGLVQLCPHSQMKNLITLASPHQGVSSYPQCRKYFGAFCDVVQLTLKSLINIPFAQEQIAPATFWHDPNDEAAYHKSSSFLAHINNENHINPEYIENLASLKKFVLVQYNDDTSIIPNESTHFGYVEHGKPLMMEETKTYIDDKLGLRALKENGTLVLLHSKGSHLELHPNWFVENIIPYLED